MDLVLNNLRRWYSILERKNTLDLSPDSLSIKIKIFFLLNSQLYIKN